MLVKNDELIINSVKDSLLKLFKGTCESLFVAGTAGAAVTVAGAPITLPLIASIVVAHAGCNYLVNKGKSNKQKALKDEFSRRYNEIVNFLKTARKTQITELSKTLEIKLKQDELVDFLIMEMDKQSVTLDDICKKINFSKDDLKVVQNKLVEMGIMLDDIYNTTTRTEEKMDAYQTENRKTLTEMKEVLATLEASQATKNQPASLDIGSNILQSHFNISTESFISVGVDEEFNNIPESVKEFPDSFFC